MALQEYPSIDGVAPSWADIGVTFTVTGGGDLLEMADIASIKSGSKVDIGEQRGVGGRVMSRTTGQGSQEASMELYRSGYRKLLKSLAKKAPTRGNQALISLVPFDILIQHTPPGETEIYTRKIKGCRISGVDAESKEGADADKVSCALNPIEVVDIVDGQEIVLI